MILARVEPALQFHQPEEQHEFRKGHRKWSEVKPACPQAAREGHRWKQKRYVHINALQMVLFMIPLQKNMNCGIRFAHRFASLATALQLPNCWYLQKFCNVVSQVFRGRPTVWCPMHVHIRMRDNQRSGGRLAAYCAKFQCISTQRTDQHFTEYCWTNCATRAFQSCKISCQGRGRSVSASGPTTFRSSFRNTTSTLLRSFLKIARCPAAKQATGVITVSKYRSLVANDTCRSVRIHRFAWNAREAAWRWKSTSAWWYLPGWSKHPSHLCGEARSRTSTVTPPRVRSCFGGWAWVVKMFVFFTFNVKPTSASEATSSSNKRHALSNVVENTNMSSANRRSNKGLRPSSRDNPSTSIFARHEDKAISSTALNKRGLSTHPWRTPPRISNPQLSTSRSLTTPVWP